MGGRSAALLAALLAATAAGFPRGAQWRRSASAPAFRLRAGPLDDLSRQDFVALVRNALVVSNTYRPQPVRVPRSRLDQDFAVALMRSSYNVADDLDFVAMDEFQKRFFLYRADEYEAYLSRMGGFMMQGDLTNASYLDFISYVQYAVIRKFMREAKQEFTERIGAEGEEITVRRAASLRDNALLPLAHDRQVGDILLGEVMSRFNGTFPVMERRDAKDVPSIVAGVEQVLKCASILGYGSRWIVLPEVSTDAGAKTRIVLTGSDLPTAWGQKILAREQGDLPLTNDFEVKIALAWLRRQGLAARRVGTKFVGDADVVHTLELVMGA